jgi:NAD(P)-dependent dehydrogenase (short-subunit alcohol dehydrogenase family)
MTTAHTTHDGTKPVCVLTGASGTLGTAFIERHARSYEIVAVYHRTPPRWPTHDGQRFVDPLDPDTAFPDNAHPVHAVRADLGTPDGARAVVDEVAERAGRLDLLVNCAGGGPWAHLLTPGTAERAVSMFQLNALAPLQLTLAAADRFWRADVASNVARGRNVVNISSTAGLVVYPDLGQGLYAGAKAALNHLTFHLASDLWDYGVRVNAVAPNTFPGRVPVADVLDAIDDLIGSDRTGEVVPLFGEE